MTELRTFRVRYTGPSRIGPVQVVTAVQARRHEEALRVALANHHYGGPLTELDIDEASVKPLHLEGS
jgi:hypothetical protein